MYSESLREISSAVEKIGLGHPQNPKGFIGLLEKSASGKKLTGEEIIDLLNGTYGLKNQRLLLDFAEASPRPRSREILLLPPLYFSSICENSCLYCDFSRHGVRLSRQEFFMELQALLKTGYRSIELVSSHDPGLYVQKDNFCLDDQKFSLKRVLPYFRMGKRSLEKVGGGMLTSNIPPVDRHSLQELKKAGLDCYLTWFETFNSTQYALLHSTCGPKKSQKFRLDSIEYALDAGIPHVAGAFLKGLSDWRQEEAFLYLFDQYLQRHKGQGFSIIGTPRLKGRYASNKMVQRYHLSDQEYELNIALDRILFDGIHWLQTREPFSLNRKLLKRFGAGVILTITCSTAPGGYHKDFKAKAQFPVFKREILQSIKTLERDGFTVRWDWDSRTLREFQRTHGRALPTRTLPAAYPRASRKRAGSDSLPSPTRTGQES